MANRIKDQKCKALFSLLMLYVLVFLSCDTTKYLPKDKYLLRRNTVVIHSDKVIVHKAEMKDNLQQIESQKPNSNFLGIPFKLLVYNARYKKYQDTANAHLKTKAVQKPEILDSSLITKTTVDMKSYLYNQGYFYSVVKDTIVTKKKKAYVTYKIEAGSNYLINKVNYGADDSAVAKIVLDNTDASNLKKNKEFSMNLLEEERSRVALLLRDHGYYRFSQENVTYELDTVNKSLFRNAESPFENAINFISTQKSNKKPTLDITIFIKPTEDSLVYNVYRLNKVTVYPDFKDMSDLDDNSMVTRTMNGITFKYHVHYVNEKVIYKHLYLLPGKLFSQTDYDKTIIKLNELGLFRSIRVNFRENPANKNLLNTNIFLNKTKKHDFIPSVEVSNGSTYTVGSSVALTFRDHNIAQGANILSITANVGLESIYVDTLGKKFLDHFLISTRFYSLNATLDFPKFLSPIGANSFNNLNVPHTIVGVGTSFMDRIDYFTLENTSINFTYNWHETSTKTWDLSPAFVNIIRLPYESDSFITRLDSNAFLKNSYKQNFIEGENISFTYTDAEKKRGQNYTFLKLGFEEAGGLLSGINSVGASLNDLYKIAYAQYTKIDFDARHYFTFPHSVFAFRFSGGVGTPYGQSSELPYVKQYFVGGPYSLRGFRVRSLGPGSYINTTPNLNINYIDQTGDIKLEWNGEYRFFIANLFSGTFKFNGAFFADAGNIWLAKNDPQQPGAEFTFGTLGQDIAADVGAGARFDIASIFTLRLDLAMPVKKPYVASDYGWVFNQIAFSDPSWRANNIILNLSIGYPF